MPTTTLCPHCAQAVSVPDSATENAYVRCPLCDAQYQLDGAALQETPVLVEEAPPLIVVGGVESQLEIDDSEMDFAPVPEASEEEPESELMHLDESGFTEISTDGVAAEFKELEEAGFAEPSMSEDFESHLTETGEELTSDMEDEFDSEKPISESEEVSSGSEELSWGSQPREEIDETEESTDKDDSAEGMAGTVAASTLATRPAKPKKKRRGTGPIGKFVGIFVFGLVGIVLGYFILKQIRPSAAEDIDEALAPYLPFLASKTPEPKPTGEIAAAHGNPTNNVSHPPAVDSPTQGPATQGTGTPATEPPKPAVDDKPPAFPENSSPAPESKPEKNELTVPFKGPLTAESATPAELNALMTAADQEFSKLSPKEFTAMCDLGHAIALLANTDDPSLAEQRVSAASLLRSASIPQRQQRVGYFGHAWLFDPRRPANRSGVWLVGKVESIDVVQTPQGNLTKTIVLVRGQKEIAKVTVFSAERPGYQPGEMAAVLGTIVPKPADRLTWYKGDDPLVVVSGVAIGVPEK